MQDTYHASLKLWGVIIQLAVGLVASAFLSDGNWYLGPTCLCAITIYIIFSKKMAQLYGWPAMDGFDKMEDTENDLNVAADGLILNRVLTSTMGVAPKYIDEYNKKYGAWLGGRTTAWYFVNHSKWASFWSWDILIWAAVGASPWLYQEGVVDVGSFIATWGLFKSYGSNVTDLANKVECLRYGIAKLDDLAECLNKSNDRKSFHHHQRAQQVRERQADLAKMVTTHDMEDVLGYVRLQDVSYENALTYPSFSWVPCPAGEAAHRKPDFLLKDYTYNLKLGPGIMYGVTHKNDVMCDSLMRLLAGYVLPQRGRIDFPPGVSSMLVSNRPTSINGSLCENLRFGCGSPEESGVDDDEMWRVCESLGMSKELVASRGMSAKLTANGVQEELHIAEASINLSKSDVAVVHLAQHIFCKPDVLVINEPSCITLTSVRVLRAYANGELFSTRANKDARKPRTTVIIHLVSNDNGASIEYAEHVDKMLDFFTPVPVTTVVREHAPDSSDAPDSSTS